MTNEEAKILLDKYNQGLASPAEAALLQYWFIHEASKEGAAMSDLDLQQLVADMRQEVMAQTKPNPNFWSRLCSSPMVWKVAAAVAAIVFGIWFFSARYMKNRQLQNHPELVSRSQDIAPGKNTATLTLANGKTITLSDTKTGVIIATSKLTYTDGTTVSEQQASATGIAGKNQLLSAQTPRGGTYQFTLPDGTRVWLNADSKISFPEQFSGKTRKILLSGEAYFEVAHLALATPKPFIVETNTQQVTVLGTHFNINAYTNEAATRTTLLEGSVKVAAGKNTITLSPNQQAINTANTLKVSPANIEQAIAWKNGDFVFTRQTLAEIMRNVARWYDVEIIYAPDVDQTETYTGKVSRSKNISQVINVLQAIQVLNFKIEGRRIYVSR
ncbi:FecR family protein [Pedobacter sp. MC2016-24]|uniref:FecR family protein n=1 Tax=Pedobacter sp. MC2016-24 TaxID=2780090 RepID=UPI00187E67F1|nr:FecR family protein [Pedobacter sp. MC2016-24]MBE9602594.1 DUF4974 domain-containing protein [Pedobacter sp. MC2016-24]